MSLPLPTVLHFYRCRNCAVVAIVAHKTPSGNEPCNGCRGLMKFLFTRAVETPEEQAVAARVAEDGRVYRHSPGVDPLRHAWAPPSPRPALEAEADRRARLRQIEADDEARHAAAYEEAE